MYAVNWNCFQQWILCPTHLYGIGKSPFLQCSLFYISNFLKEFFFPPVNLKCVKYVNGCLAIVTSDTNLDNISTNLYCKVSSIKFSIELKKITTSTFLDLNLNWQNHCLKFSVYRKPFKHFSFIFFCSQYNNKINESVLISMFLRVFLACIIT